MDKLTLARTILGIILLWGIATSLTSCDKGDEVDILIHDQDSGLNWISCSGVTPNEAIYYVKANGDDRADGTTETTAFRTIAKALQTVAPSGKVRILIGTYFESIGIQSCGVLENPIVVEGWGGTPTIDGKSNSAIGIYCEDCRGYTFRNLSITRFTDMGIGISRSKQIILNKINAVSNGNAVILKSWGLEGYGLHVENSFNIEISACDITGNGPNPQVYPDYLMGTGINTFGNTQVVIRNNKAYRNTGGGILVEDSYNVVVEENEIYENDLDARIDQWWDGGLWLDGGGAVTVRNNHFHDNMGPGIQISDEDHQSPKGYVLQNNISENNIIGIFIWNFGTTDWPAQSIIKNSDNTYKNNSKKDVWIVKDMDDLNAI